MLENKKWWIIGMVGLMLLGCFAGGQYSHWKDEQRAAEGEELLLEEVHNRPDAIEENNAEDGLIQVYVAGEVEKPGVYKLPAASRVYEALEQAGVKETSELRYIGMAREIIDGETILVPAIGEADAGAGPGGVTASGKVNINRATAQEIEDKLSGIGPVLAQRIVDYREEHGLFRQAEDLKKVGGIGDKKYEDIKDDITVY